MNNFNYLWIFLMVCCYFGVNPSEVQVKHPNYRLSQIKQVCQYMIYHAGATYDGTGKIVGGLDNVTVRWNVLKVGGLIAPGRGQNKELAADVNNLSKILTKNS
jgi:hypothetical protein